MHSQTIYFDVSPRIVPAGKISQVTVRALYGHRRLDPDADYILQAWPVGGTPDLSRRGQPENVPFSCEEGLLSFRYYFFSEQEYIFVLQKGGASQPGWTAEFHLYALESDLFQRRPFKGDLHMHSHYSDGREAPAYVTAACRKIGMDFMAITDHGQYAPSLEAIQAFQGVPVDLRIFPGEEVHPPDNPVHMLNIGGQFSINELFDTQSYHQEVQALADRLNDLPPGSNRYTYASCAWSFERIRQAGGLGILCHPYWIRKYGYDVPIALTDLLFERQPFDAYELIGGYFRHEIEANTLQVARYHEERAHGKRLPIIGVSDSHGVERSELFGWYYTILFATSCDLPDVIQGVKDLFSVAVEALPGETARVYGPLRLVQYALFLSGEIFPLHDELCVEEGRLMFAHAAGEPSAARSLSQLQGRTAALYNHLWGQV